MPDISRIATHLWFRGDAKEAADFYVSLIPDSRIVDCFTFHNAGPDQNSSYTSVTFDLAGQRYMGLDKCPVDLNFATSISVICETQSEIDRLWNGLLDGGAPQQCGWLTDKYGLSWQIVPSILPGLFRDNSESGRRAMDAMLSMVKLDIAALQAAYDGIRD